MVLAQSRFYVALFEIKMTSFVIIIELVFEMMFKYKSALEKSPVVAMNGINFCGS